MAEGEYTTRELLLAAQSAMANTRAAAVRVIARLLALHENQSGDDAKAEAERLLNGALGVPATEPSDDSGPLRDGWQISIGPGHAGFGCYAHMTEYPDEGAVCLATFDPAEYPDATAGVALPDGAKQ